jgi:hypothetical protein
LDQVDLHDLDQVDLHDSDQVDLHDSDQMELVFYYQLTLDDQVAIGERMMEHRLAE